MRVLWIALLLLAPAVGCAAEPARLNVLSYNIHHGEGTDGKFDLPRIAAVIKASGAQVTALQEVDEKTKRAGGVDQASELGKLTKTASRFAKAMDYSGGGYGEAALSSLPILESKTIPLPADEGYEPRSAVAIRIQPKGMPPVWFVGTHLDHTPKDRQRLLQVDALLKALSPNGVDPVILVGDMNAQPGSEPMRRLLEHFEDASRANPKPTYPVVEPNIRIDWVLTHPKGAWRTVESRVIDERIASDHRPLYVELEWLGVRADEQTNAGRPDTIERLSRDLHRQDDRPGR